MAVSYFRIIDIHYPFQDWSFSQTTDGFDVEIYHLHQWLVRGMAAAPQKEEASSTVFSIGWRWLNSAGSSLQVVYPIFFTLKGFHV